MSRYIDAYALKERLIQNITLTNAIDRSFSEAPSIDIVRCKECRWATETRMKSIEGDVIYLKTCPTRTEVIDDDDFCSYGEREGE